MDDGSTDSTAAVAEGIAREDDRFRVVRQSNGGPSAARNAGIIEASGDWLLFLDADDEITPEALTTFAAAIEATPAATWFYGGWRRIIGGGTGTDSLPEPMPDVRRRIAVGCPFAIHACVVRTAAVRDVGAFDESLRTCEDWDLWRKLASAGHVPHPIEAVVAVYLVRSTSASSVIEQMLVDGFVVIDRAFEGEAETDRDAARVAFASYLAGIQVGRGTAPDFALDALTVASAPETDPTLLASFLVTAVPLGAERPLENWLSIPKSVQDDLVRFLETLASHVGARRLAERTVRRVELEASRVSARRDEPARLFHGLVVDVDLLGGTPPNLEIPTGVERVHLRAVLGDRVVTTTEMAVLSDRIAGRDLIDALVEGTAWPALEACILEPLLPSLSLRNAGSSLEVRRGDVHLGHIDGDGAGKRALLNAVGWPLFVQEFFGDATSSPDSFYDARVTASRRRARTGDAVTIDIADIPSIWTRARRVHIDVRVAGEPFDALVLKPSFGHIASGRVRSQILLRNGVQLARAAMKAWLARPRQAGTPLAEVLAETLQDRLPFVAPAAKVYGHHVHRGPIRSRLQNRTISGTAGELVAGASDAYGRPILSEGASGAVVIGAWSPPTSSTSTPAARPARTNAARRSAASFEALFADDADPWAYTTGYEQTKYEQTLAMLPEGVDRALELACAEGHFTVQLAEHVGSVTATDVSQLALGRAAERCSEKDNVTFEHHDLFAEPVRGSWPLIICSEVLYYAGGKGDLARVVESIVTALADDGVLVTAHANLVVDDPNAPGFDWDEDYGSLGIQDALLATGTVVLERELVTPMYRIQRYRRGGQWEADVVRVAGEASTELSSDVAAHFLPHGGKPARSAPLRSRPLAVPVLMYHRVSPDGLGAMRRWRVTPDEFAAQLDFLSSAGYKTISPAQWRDAANFGAELPEQPLLLTFDDGYQDFADHAFPALQDRGMTATVMLVTGHVGRINGWDAHREGLPLMSWDTIRHLFERGIEFGAHTASHVPLTAVESEQALQEVATSISEVRSQLGTAPAAFAYPYGDVTPAVRDLVGLCGVDLAFSCAPGIASAQDDPLMLPRVEVRGDAPLRALIRELAEW